MTSELDDPSKWLNARQAARLVPSAKTDRDGNPIPTHQVRVVRYITKGHPAPDGKRVYLGGLFLPSGWVTTAAAICEFAAALTPGNASGPAPAPVVRRRQSDARADRALTALGL
jgi:hypothetical protein